jgi:putative transcriptional regulator
MNATIDRHLDDATMMSYAAGSLGEPLAAAAAAHVSMCAHCRRELKTMEAFGAALMEDASSEGPAKVQTLHRPSVAAPALADVDGHAMTSRLSGGGLPEPIARKYGLTIDTIPWRRLGPGVWHHRLAVSPGVTGDLRLLKIAAGRKMPEHGHGGTELTLVLDGSFNDETGTYRRGDIQDVDGDVEHRPVAGEQTGCICLVAAEQPARFKGIISRLIQPWTGM